MARSFNGSSQWMETSSQYPRVNGTIFIAFKPNWNSNDSVDHTLFYCDNGASGVFGAQHYSDNNWYVGWQSGSEYRIVVPAASMSVSSGIWYNLIYRWDDTTNLSALFLNGLAKGTGSTLATANLSGQTFLFASLASVLYNGALGAIALWDESLSDSDVALLGAWRRPDLVDPTNLISYWPLAGTASPEPDSVGGLDLTLVGSPPQSTPHHTIDTGVQIISIDYGRFPKHKLAYTPRA